MTAISKRSRSDSAAVVAPASKKAKPTASEKHDDAASESASNESESAEDAKGPTETPSPDFTYTSPMTDAQCPTIHLLFYSSEVEERCGFKAWPLAAVREIYARVGELPQEDQQSELEKLDGIDTFPLVQAGHVDDDDAPESGPGHEMYEVAIQAIAGAPKEHSGWQDAVLQKEQPSGDAPALKLELDGDSEDDEDPGRPYHGRWWWVSSQPAGAEDEPAIKMLTECDLGERTGMWM